MASYAMLVDYQYCSGCQSCEVSCKNEKNLSKDNPWGVKVLQNGPYDLENGKWEWDYIPAFSEICDLCEDRVKDGAQPACVLHCLANCLTYGTIEELSAKMETKGKKMYIFKP